MSEQGIGPTGFPQTTRWNGPPTGTGPMVGSPHHDMMVSMELDNYELDLYLEIMRTPMGQWPEGVLDLAKRRTKKIGLCGDVLAQVVIDWIKAPRTME